MSSHAIIDVETWTRKKIHSLLRKYGQPCLVENDGYFSLYLVNPEILHHIPPVYWNKFVNICDAFTESWLSQTGICEVMEQCFVGKELTDEVLEDVFQTIVERLHQLEQQCETTYIERLENLLIQELTHPETAITSVDVISSDVAPR
ncbi:hypothetical protein [Alicyclobacillus pomorum]|jgi:hypothetical protein|uniref:hypothetical protein n=1 Tax=Alicyclobacillus pomorum TaxID=204470 RepID=UPI0039EFB485